MTDNPEATPAAGDQAAPEIDTGPPKTWTDLAGDLWAFLTSRGAAINYRFVDMTIEVPRDTGTNAPRATWRLNGTMRITTSDNQSKNADPFRI